MRILSISISVGPGFDILSTLRSFPKGTAAGPSGLHNTTLLDAALIPLATPVYVLFSGTL